MTIEERVSNVFDISFKGKICVTAGFNVISLITQHHFVWIEFHCPVSRKQLSILRKLFEEIERVSLFCNVQKSNKKAMRTAEFFGFKYVSEESGIVVMRKD